MSELAASTASPYHMSYSSERYSPVVAFGQNTLFHAYLRWLLVLAAQPYLHHLTRGGCDNRSVQTWNSTPILFFSGKCMDSAECSDSADRFAHPTD